MSFGYSVGDFVLLTQLAWQVVQNSRKACGAHDGLTSEVTSLHIVLHRLEVEVSKPNSILGRSDGGLDRKEELVQLSSDCRRVLRVLDGILEKYNALSEEKRSVMKLWKKVQFGNGEMLDLVEIRLKISTSTSALTLFLNLLSIGSQGKVESYMESQGDELREMRRSLNWITASMQAKAPKAGEGSILTTYAGDDKAIWKDFRRELIKERFSSEALQRHKETIKDYVLELGSRGALDDVEDDGEKGMTSLHNPTRSNKVEDLTNKSSVEKSEEDSGLDSEVESQEKSEEEAGQGISGEAVDEDQQAHINQWDSVESVELDDEDNKLKNLEPQLIDTRHRNSSKRTNVSGGGEQQLTGNTQITSEHTDSTMESQLDERRTKIQTEASNPGIVSSEPLQPSSQLPQPMVTANTQHLKVPETADLDRFLSKWFGPFR